MTVEHRPTAGERLAARALASVRNRFLVVGVGLALVLALYLIMRGSTAPTKDEKEANALSRSADSVVTLDSVGQRLAGIELFTVTARNSNTFTANGTITYDANRVSVVSPRVEGHIVAVRADLGQQVPVGGLLAVLESADVGQIRGELERARANLDITKRNYEREDRLFREQISPQKEMLEAENAYRSAQAEYRSAVARLSAVGAAGGRAGIFDLRSPIAGTVVERNASPGATVGPSNNLFTVADLRNVWITVDVYEGDLSRIHRGAVATVVPTALAGESFSGRVTYAGGVVDTASRTFKVRVEVGNPNLRLRPGMFAQVVLETALDGAPATTLTIPETAVQDVNGKQVVFVASPGRGVFIARQVTLGARTGNGVRVVTRGLTAGEMIVVKGAFQLKAELEKASFAE